MSDIYINGAAGTAGSAGISVGSDGTLIVQAPDFDCEQIFTCGQCFRWKPEGNWWKGVAFGRQLTLCSDSDAGTIILKNCTPEEYAAVWREYFDMDTDYAAIKVVLAGYDRHLAAATEYGRGIRILRQEPFETLISFIISANNNIPRISKCIEALSERFGKAAGTDPETGHTYYAFPTPEALAAATPEQISEACHAGYRCRYIVEAAKQYIERGGNLSHAETYIGVGPKVAACIRLFTGIDTEAFPVDVWVRRLMTELYFPSGSEPTLKEINTFVKEHFKKYGGFAQQYLFYWRRSHVPDEPAASGFTAAS